MNNSNKPEKLNPPNGSKKMLLHTCCAPCSGGIAKQLIDSGIECSVFFYNPNIYPLNEYAMRKKEHMRYADQLNIPFIDGGYDSREWMEHVKGLEDEPERGARCTICFDFRLEKTALYAHKNGFPVFATTLGLSRWKDLNQVNEAGKRAAAKFLDLTFWDHNWRKQGGSERMYKIAKHEEFYKQEYCGCIYSLRDANKWRQEKGEPEIEINKHFYGQ